MKLRFRSLESKETLKIETPNSSTLQILKDAIADRISTSSESLHLSLNRKDEIISSPTDSLTSLGIASGDLIYYTQNPNGFSSEHPLQIPVSAPPPQIESGKPSLPLETNIISDIQQPSSDSNLPETLVQEKDETLDSYEEGFNQDSNFLSSVPCLLERVYKEEVVNGNTQGDHKLLIVAVHAVFLESGFVCFDSVNKNKINGVGLPEGWTSKSTVSLQYTLPQLLSGKSEILQTVDMKFQTMGKFLTVYGSLSKQNPVGFFRLDTSRFVPSINFLCVPPLENIDSACKSNHEKEVFELWKIAKDGLALPLLIDLCDKTGLESPPCFTRLPTDLKLRILEFLPGIDIAKVSCVSSELRYLSSNNDLWKLKYMEEFSLFDSGENTKDRWREMYVRSRENTKRKRRPIFTPFPYPSLRRGPRAPFGIGNIIGGDHDRFPAPFGSGPGLRFPARRNFVPHCNLGGFDA